MNKDQIHKLLTTAGIDNPWLEARWICAEYPDLSPKQAESIVKRRAAGEPLSRIFGWREFYGLRMMIGNDTLDPRPETELIVDLVLKHPMQNPRILDLGTGTGCLAIVLKKHIPESSVIACDVSAGALAIARRNAAFHQTDITFILSDWWQGIGGLFDIIVSNPPYIADAVIDTLDTSVREYDPHLALSGGSDGLDAYRALLGGLSRHLAPQGRAFFEIGFDQGSAVTKLAQTAGWKSVIHHDLAGQDRIIEIEFGDKS